MANPFSVFLKAAQRLPISPQERAFLAFFWQFLLTTGLNATGAFGYGVGTYLIQHGNLSSYQWLPVLGLQGVTTLHAIATGIRKYITAHADMQYSPTGVVASAVATDLSAANPFSPQVVAQLGENLLAHIGPRILSGVSSILQQAQQPAPVPAPTASVPHPQAQPAVSAPLAPAPPPGSVGVNTQQTAAVMGTSNWMNT